MLKKLEGTVMGKEISCQQCGGEMARHKFSEGNWRVLLGLIVVIAGIAIAVTFPVIGWLIGLVMVIYGFGMGGKRKKGWRCDDCGYFFEAR